ncbi:alpha/beta hydrolase [Haladaptatus caseinilyticus]|uniref:alpha/beta hydrolase n=1 Tax=Haladaptatus caseinilyticus TaxID=2993314 RepID=UPI00224A7C16|nr:alpha/beta hydrolase [Haladaptatus caseinilyticus]
MQPVKRERLIYRSTPERDLAVDVYARAGVEDAPAVALIHGGGWMTNHQGMFEQHLTRLAERGVVGLEFTHRLSSEARFPAPIMDIKYGIKWLKANANLLGLDPGRVVIGGHSAGAHLAALAAVTPDHQPLEPEDGPDESSRVDAAIVLNGLYNLEKLGQIQPSRLFASEFIYELFGDRYIARREAYRAGSCSTHIDGDEPPFLVLASTNDQEVPLYESVQLYEQLSYMGNEPEQYISFGGDHFCFTAEGPDYESGLKRIESFLADQFSSFAI